MWKPKESGKQAGCSRVPFWRFKFHLESIHCRNPLQMVHRENDNRRFGHVDSLHRFEVSRTIFYRMNDFESDGPRHKVTCGLESGEERNVLYLVNNFIPHSCK